MEPRVSIPCRSQQASQYCGPSPRTTLYVVVIADTGDGAVGVGGNATRYVRVRERA